MCFDFLRRNNTATKPQLGSITQVSWQKIKDELIELGVILMLKDSSQPDKYMYNVSEADWSKVVPFLTFSGEAYVYCPEAPDCDDYSKKASVEAAFEFHLHCLECWGSTPYKSDDNPVGRHAFSLVRVGEKDYRIFECNAAFEDAGGLFKFGEHGYVPSAWRI